MCVSVHFETMVNMCLCIGEDLMLCVNALCVGFMCICTIRAVCILI